MKNLALHEPNRLYRFPRRGWAGGRQAGSVLVMASIAIFVLLGFAGLAIDVGYLEHMKRRLQTSADAGALAGTLDLAQTGIAPCTDNSATSYATVQTDAIANVTADGFTNGSNNVTVTVNCGGSITPGTYYVGDPTAVEVIVNQTNQASWFMTALGYPRSGVTARAVAHLGSGNACMIALDPTAKDSLWLQGSANLNSTCGLFSDSNNRQAVKDDSSSFCTNAQIIGAVGGAANATVANCNGGNTTVETGMMPIPDPFASLPAPIASVTSANCDVTSDWTATSGPRGNGDLATITPKQAGMYVICGSLTGGTLPQGDIYVVTGDVTNSASITMDPGSGGVMFYLTCMGGCSGTQYGAVTLNGTSGNMVTASAPTSGTYHDVLFYGDRSAACCSTSIINGNSAINISGAIYLPGTYLTLNGTSDWTVTDMALVADTINISGTFTLNANAAGFPGNWPMSVALLGE